MASGWFSFLAQRKFQIITVVLVLQAICLYGLSRQETTPVKPPLRSFPRQFAGPWTVVQEGVVEKETQDVLQADDTLDRLYSAPDGIHTASLFIASFKSQRTGKAPHSPKNCLPGSGWMPVVADRIQIAVPNWPAPIEVNRYMVQKGDSRSLVLYWYQSHQRAVASEYAAKIYLVLDSLRYNRSDTALVRVVTDASSGDVDSATKVATDFTRAFFPALAPFMP
jgi:EpsI family protein